MVRYIKEMNPVEGLIPAMRIGIHSGPLVAGVIENGSSFMICGEMPLTLLLAWNLTASPTKSM